VSRSLFILSRLTGSFGVAENLFQAALNLAPWQHDTPTAPLTLKTNISAKTYHQPIIAAAGMWLAQPDTILQRQRDKLHVHDPFCARFRPH
jgi:hypothetical protein